CVRWGRAVTAPYAWDFW
nr:immunoglobulin heavy chain junction region [Macaca mulatta]